MQDTVGDGIESRAAPDTEINDWVSHNVQILVLGDESCCKAKFISKFLNNGIDRDPSLENGFRKTIQVEDKSYSVNIHTNVGQESILGVCDSNIRQTQAAIFVYSIYSRESFTLFGGWRDRLHREFEHMPIALVGCACAAGVDRNGSGDVSHSREVTVAEARKMAEACGGVFFEIGANENKTAAAITEVFSVLLQRTTTNKKTKSGYFLGNDKPTDDSENSQQKYTEMEIIVCGDVFVGKTQLIRQLLAMPFQTQYYATLDSTVHKHKAVIQDVGFSLKLVDVGGLDLEAVLNRDALMTAQGFVLVYAANSRDSFIALERVRKKIQQSKIEARIPTVLIANKVDSFRQVSREEGQAMAKRWSCAYFEMSANSTTCQDDIYECFEVLISDIQHLYAHVPLLDTIGEIDRQGYLGKIGNTFKTVNRRYFSLKDCTLSYSNEIAQPIKDSISLFDNATTEIVNDAKNKEGHYFTVGTPEHKFSLQASSEAERDSWMTSIRANLALADIMNSLLEEVTRSMLWESCAKMPEVARRRINSNVSNNSSEDFHSSSSPSTPTGTPTKSSPSISISVPTTPSTPLGNSTSGMPVTPGSLGVPGERAGGGMDRMGSMGSIDLDDFMAPMVAHDLSSSPSASPTLVTRSPMTKPRSFFQKKEKK